MTRKLFYEDSHMVTFSAIVERCEASGEYYEVVLDRTAFFPEGGGQYADTGMLADVSVSDVQERGGIVYHKMREPLQEGAEIIGTIDWEERFSKMQQHSGEHIVSGLVHEIYGYDNVGFHMGKDAVTMDFNGILTKEQLKVLEKKANEAVVKNLEVQVLYPSKEELASIEYRSKIEIEGQVRIVEIPGYDVCACCAPHVKRTGEIGLIKLLQVQNYKGGVRVSMLCGFRALEDFAWKSESIKNLSVLLSAKEDEVTEEVKRLKEELAEKKNELVNLQQKLLRYRAAEIPKGENIVILFEEELTGNAPRELVNFLLERDTVVGAVFSGNETEGYRYVIGSREKDVRVFANRLKEALGARGGGKPEMVQGSVSGGQEKIRKEVEACSREVFGADCGGYLDR